jgi:hypothetical protein
MAATRYAYVAVYQKPRHVVGTDTFLGRVEIQSGVLLALYEGTFSMAEFAAVVRDHGTQGGRATFPEISGAIARAWFGSVA